MSALRDFILTTIQTQGPIDFGVISTDVEVVHAVNPFKCCIMYSSCFERVSQVIDALVERGLIGRDVYGAFSYIPPKTETQRSLFDG